MGRRVALVPYATDRNTAQTLRAWADAHGGHATLFRGTDKSAGAFHPLPAALLLLHQRLKSALDPVGIFNPRRLYAGF